VSTVTCQHIVKAGYKIGDRVVRAAQVVVVDPEETTEQPTGETTGQTTGETPAAEDADVRAGE
jgi:molecular chaperone GrpE